MSRFRSRDTALGVGILALSVICCLGLLRSRRGLVVVTVRGTSMEPAYRDGDRALARRGVTPARGDVVVAARPAFTHGAEGPETRAEFPAHNEMWLIKRVAAIPGDLVPGGWVPPGQLVLLGDNPANSLDSRQVGYFPADALLGVVLRRLPRLSA
ncbi:S26 family signal peptidase [Streptomyces sp. NPDC047725]|uniref:S26 family signal peptidase n=1 Tax=Streptomyces sp. NPDC047725 TaxID=3365487 RepID=UPI003721C01B